MVPLQAQRIDIIDVDIANNVVDLLKTIPCLAVIDLELEPTVMDILARPELNKITIVTNQPRQNLPLILKNKAKVFKMSENFNDEVETKKTFIFIGHKCLENIPR